MSASERRRIRRRTPLLLAALALIWAGESAWGQPPSSSSFVLSQSTMSSGGESAVSSSFVLDGSAAQPATVGEAASASFALQSGFWTSLSSELPLRIEGVGTGSGSVTGPGIACDLDAGVASGDCLENFTHGTSVGFTASPDAANQFDGWTGCDSTSTAVLPDDTCQVTLITARTVTAGFTLLGTLGDRVWRDIDGDGMQDAGEPGLDGVTVTLDDGAGFSLVTATAGGGLYTFIDVPPGTYTVAVDTATLPAGVVPTFDLDGTATPHTTSVSLASGQDRTDVDFGYQPLVDLAITKTDSEDPLPGGVNLIYTITVQNLGPGIATGVEVTDMLPGATTRVATTGCAEDPAGTPTCSLGDLGIGATTSYTIEVAIDPAPPGSITNIATVSAVEVDIDGSNNTASETTTLDDDPPEVDLVDTDPSTADGELTPCETVHGFGVQHLVVRFDEPMLDPAGHSTPGDVTNPTSWSLVSSGPDAELATVACGPPAGDDVLVGIAAVTYEAGTQTATLVPLPGETLPPGLYRLFGCGEGPSALTDLAGNPIDGDGDGVRGGDFPLRFRTDPANLFANGSLDCDLGGWDLDSSDPSEIVYAPDDLDGSADSGSAAIETLLGGTNFSLSQCVAVETLGSAADLELGGWLRMDTEAPGIGIQLGCTFHEGSQCTGPASAPSVASTFLGDTGSLWVELSLQLTAPAGSQSGVCGVGLVDAGADGFDARLDRVWLRGDGLIFTDGFESGNTSAWSGTVP